MKESAGDHFTDSDPWWSHAGTPDDNDDNVGDGGEDASGGGSGGSGVDAERTPDDGRHDLVLFRLHDFY